MSCRLSDVVREHVIHLRHVRLSARELRGDAFYLQSVHILLLTVIVSEFMSYGDSGRATSIVTHSRTL